MLYYESASTDPYFNLAIEEYIFEKMDRSKSYFLLWQNENTIVVGKYQNTAEEINQEYVDKHSIHVVRRLSGGGAVYHDAGNLNYTFIVDQDSNPGFDFEVFVVPVIKTLEKIYVSATFSGRNDLTIDGMKFSGNSQYAKNGRLLHHGCIMLNSNLTNVADALKVKTAKFASKNSKSVRSRVTTINANAPNPVTMEQFKRLLKESILESGRIEPVILTEQQLEEISNLRNQKYATWDWNYGSSPAYNMKREKKFDTGVVTVYLHVERGRIKDIRFYGDFFGNGDLRDLEASMIGLALDEYLEQVLVQLNINYYMAGITAHDLYILLMY